MSLENRKKNPGRIILILVLLSIAAGGVYFILQGRGYETTDNAQLDSDILSVRSSVTAYVEQIRFRDNQEVKVGDTLLILDATELRARVAQAKAAKLNAEAAFASASNRANAGVKNIEAALMNTRAIEESMSAAQANLNRAQLAYDRVVHLLDIKAATQEQKENAEAALAVAKAEVERIRDQEKASESSRGGLNALSLADLDAIQSARAAVQQREAELALAEEQLSRAWVISPFNGVVTKRAVQTGQFVSAGQALCTVVQLDEIWVTANFKETQIGNIRPGQSVEVKVDAIPGRHFTGKVASFSGATGSKFALIPPDNATGNYIKVTQRFPIRIALDPIPVEDRMKLFPGLSAFVKVKVN